MRGRAYLRQDENEGSIIGPMRQDPSVVRSRNVEIVLTVLKALGFVAVMAIAPNAVQMFKPERRRTYHYTPDQLRKTTYYLKQRGDIRLTERDGQTYASLTPQGWKRLARLERVQVKPPQKTKWDGKWRVV